MASIGLKPFSGDGFELPYQSRDHTDSIISFINLAGMVPGRNPAEARPIPIGAHYDSVIDAPCSDDNATAVAVALAIAEEAVRKPTGCDIVIALFDAEEPPWFLGPDMGSIRFFQNHCRNIDFRGVIIMDLIGHDVTSPHIPILKFIPRIRNLLFVLGAESHPSMASALKRSLNGARGLTVFPTLNRYVGDMSDHHVFRQAGQPYLFLTCAQGEHYHAPEDDMEWVNIRKVHRVFRLVRTLVRRIDDSHDSDEEITDTTEMEIRTIRRSLGWLLPFFLKFLRLKSLKNRKDIDAMAEILVPAFGGMGLEFLREVE